MTAVHAVDTEPARLLTGLRRSRKPEAAPPGPVTGRCGAALVPPDVPSTRYGTSSVATRVFNSGERGRPATVVPVRAPGQLTVESDVADS